MNRSLPIRSGLVESHPRLRFGRARKLLAVVALLATAQNAAAGNQLVRGAAGRSAADAAATAAAAAAQAQAAQQAAQSAAQGSDALRRAMEAVKARQAIQGAARDAARASAGSAVPDGLAAGGLEVAPGAAPGTTLWRGASLPGQVTEGGLTTVTVKQEEEKAILTWSSFNVGEGTTLKFDQSAGGEGAREWIALNRVADPSASPSQILGRIEAEGQVYVLNPNGVLFGGTSQVNVATLVASGLDFEGADLEARNRRFLNGLLGTTEPAFAAGDRPAGAITVEAGAELTIAPRGQAALFGGEVVNRGRIEAPDGQVLLAAGEGVTLSKAADQRGYAPPVVTGDGRVENTGLVSTPRGNITMLGATTLQGGVLTATTGAEANGSIVIGADGHATELGAGSITQVLPDQGGERVIGAGSYQPSVVEVHGRTVTLRGGAQIYAPSGNVTLGETGGGGAPISPGGRVELEAGALIDVSGLSEVVAPMEQHGLEAQLRANELRDNPLLRDNPALRGRTVHFDGRLGVDGVADLSGYYDLVERDVAQLMTRGGTVTLLGDDLVLRQGSVIDLSGGSTRYLEGWLRSTQLLDAAGNRVRIEDAVNGVAYAGIDGDFVVDHGRWNVTQTFASGLGRTRARFERGYVEGASAGTLAIGRPRTDNTSLPVPNPDPLATGDLRVFDGEVVARTVQGPRQQQLSTGSVEPTLAWREAPAGATLVVNRAGDVTIADAGTRLGEGIAEESLRGGPEVLPARWFDGETFSNVSIAAGYADDRTAGDPGTTNFAPGGHLTVGAGTVVDLGAGGSFRFEGKRADVDGTISAAGGTVELRTLQLPENRSGGELAAQEQPTTRLGATGVIDVAGRWSNPGEGVDARPQALHGGKVTLTGTHVELEEGSLVDVSGGARVDAAGTKVTGGNGGAIVLDVTRPWEPSQNVREAFPGTLVTGGTLSGHALGAGGSLSLYTTDDVVIGDPLAGGRERVRVLDPHFFTEGGFSSFSIVGERSVTVTAGTVLAPRVESLVTPERPGEIPSGARLDDVLTRHVHEGGLARPMTLSLSAVPLRTPADLAAPADASLDVQVQAGASILMNPGSTVKLSSVDELRVDGRIVTPGGRIELKGDDKGLRNPLGETRITLGAAAELLAAGYLRTTPDGLFDRRSVEAGGAVTLTAPGEVRIEDGAVIDVSGASGPADLPALAGRTPDAAARWEERLVGSRGGSIAISAGGGLVDGELRLAPGAATAAGGSLTVEARGAPLVVRGGARPDDGSGSLTLVAGRVNASGADDLTLGTVPPGASAFSGTAAILFDGDVSLQTRRSLTLSSPILGIVAGGAPASVALESGHVRLDGVGYAQAPSVRADGLDGRLTVRARTIDVEQTVWLGCPFAECSAGGFGEARFIASGDVRLSDHDLDGSSSTNPGLLSNGAIRFDAAQVYVTSRLQEGSEPLERAPSHPGFLVQSDVSVTVAGNGAPAPVPLSFGERLTLRAPEVVQGGVLRAPQGQLRLEGTGDGGSVTLLAGSLTSASLEGAVVPFGPVVTGGTFRGYDAPGAAPSKSVSLEAPAVAVQDGAVVDVSGGGDLLGHVFVPGNGGSRDILSDAGSFAVVPSLGTAPAPRGGAEALRDRQLRTGDVVWLQGVPGLRDGYYTLLPSHYALLPGGLLVKPLGGSFASASPVTARPDGSVVVSGFRAVDGTEIRDAGHGRFVVMPRGVFGRYSELVTYSFEGFAERLAGDSETFVRSPRDAGAVVLDAGESLVLQGTGRLGAEHGGRLGELDVAADRIAVVAPGAATPEGYLVLEPKALEEFGAGSVLIGGTRAARAGGTAVNVTATDVVVDTAGTTWTAPEILVAATGEVTVRDGSTLVAEGTPITGASPLLLEGDGALLRVSTGGRVGIIREGAGEAGVLRVGAASLGASGSLSMEGSRTVQLSDGAVLDAPEFDLASTRVNLGEVPEAERASGTNLTGGAIARLSDSSDLLIRGHDAIHLYGDAALGGRGVDGEHTVERLTLDTPLLQGHDGPVGGARIAADVLTLRNAGGPADVEPAGGTGTLALDVDTLVLGPGEIRVAGYRAVEGRAGAIEARGDGALKLGGSLSLETAGLRAASGATGAIEAAGAVSLTREAADAALDAGEGLGGRIAIGGAEVLLDTSVALPAGAFSAHAREGTMTVGPTASIDVRGVARELGEELRFAPGGTIELEAARDLAIDSGATLDVSGSDRGGDAGAIAIEAGGTARVDGAIRGAAVAGHTGGSFALGAGSLAGPGISPLAEALGSGGFDASLALRLRAQDLIVSQGDRLAAHEVVLRSDRQVTIAGEVAANGGAAGADGGTLRVIGGTGVAISATARLSGRAGEAAPGEPAPAGGTVELAAASGSVDVASASVIDVQGGQGGDSGRVVVRAAVRDGGDVAIDRLAGEIRGAGEVVVQGTRTYEATGGVVDAVLADAITGDASGWLAANRTSIQGRLSGSSGLPPIHVAPGIAIASGGDLTIASDLDLSRIAGGAGGHGHLSFTTPGTLEVRATLSDGFDGVARGAALRDARSFDVALESGHDLVLQPDAMIRTGTGDLSLVAGRDLRIVDPVAPGSRPATIYTAGRRTEVAQGFTGAAPEVRLGEFSTQGGDVVLEAGRDILAPLASQTTSAWLFRQGATEWNGEGSSSTVKRQTSWSVVHENFEQSVGALGGGDVRVEAGRDVVQLQVAIPTTGHLTTATGGVAREQDLVVRGGGDLALSAGGDVVGGIFMLGRGDASVRAGGSIGAGGQALSLRGAESSGELTSLRTLAPLFGLMDARATVTASAGVELEGIYDPMRQGQIAANLAAGSGSAFSGYTDRTALEATSLSGSVTYANDPWASVDLTRNPGLAWANPAWQVTMRGSGGDVLNTLFSSAPPTLRLTSLGGDVVVRDRFNAGSTLTMAAADRGTVELLATGDVRLMLNTLQMEDVAASRRRGPLAPFATSAGLAGERAELGTLLTTPTDPIHAGDPSPARILALEGSVCAQRSGSCALDPRSLSTRVLLPKPLELWAGEDVVAGNYQPQNNRAEDVSWIHAGRDLKDVLVQARGGGTVVLEAGRDVLQVLQDTMARGGAIYGLGDRTSASGTAVNPGLPAGDAADVYIVAGLAAGVDYEGFAAAYLDPANRQEVVRTYLPELATYMSGLDGRFAGLAGNELVAAFDALPEPRRAVFLQQVYFEELKQTGIDYNDAGGPRFQSYDRGFRAVSLLFPGDVAAIPDAQRGDVLLSAKPVETQAHGDITILAPYGRVQVGAEIVPKNVNPALGGVVTRRGGDIRIMADQNVDLFTSRVFTLQGGDITMWTSNGSITAGAGAKTSVFNVPLTYAMTTDGVVTVNVFGLQTGAGIGVLDAVHDDSPDRPRSRLDLIAPRGEVNAGDAGIRVVGDLNIAAQVVVGLENIQVSGGRAQGVPTVEAPSGAALTSASSLARAAAQEGVGPEAQPRTAVADLPSIITVEVVGYETNGDADEDEEKRRKGAGESR